MLAFLVIVCSTDGNVFSQIIINNNKIINIGEECGIGLYNTDGNTKKQVNCQFGPGSIICRVKNSFFLQTRVSMDTWDIEYFNADTDNYKSIADYECSDYAISGDKVTITDDHGKNFVAFDLSGNCLYNSINEGQNSKSYDSTNFKWIPYIDPDSIDNTKTVVDGVHLITDFHNNNASYKLEDIKYSKTYNIGMSLNFSFKVDNSYIYYISGDVNNKTFCRIDRKTCKKNIKPLPFNYCGGLVLYKNNFIFDAVWNSSNVQKSVGEALFTISKDGLDLSPFYKKEDFCIPYRQAIKNIKIFSFCILKNGQRIAKGYNIKNAFISNNELIYFDYDGIYYYINEINLKNNKYRLIKKSNKVISYENHSYTGTSNATKAKKKAM